MDYEKAYNEALERAKRLRDSFYQTMNAKRVVEEIFPQLAESEDERIIEGFHTLIRGIRRTGGLTLNKVPLDKCEAWLEKQKESLHIPETCKENADSFTDDIIEIRSFQRGIEEGRRLEKQKEQKSAEWSEEDQNNVNVLLSIIGEVREMNIQNTLVGYVETVERKRRFDKLEAWLKSLRPQPHWKPSEEQIEALEWMLTTVTIKDGGKGVVLKNLVNDLKKQM